GRRAGKGRHDESQKGRQQHRHQDHLAVHVLACSVSAGDAPPDGRALHQLFSAAFSLRREGIMFLRSPIFPSRESPFLRLPSSSSASAAPSTSFTIAVQAAPTLLPLAASASVLPSLAAWEAALRSKGTSTSMARSIDCSKSLRLISGE